MSSDDTPMSRLRERHRREYSSLMAGPWCREYTCIWPCDVIAALDELEERDDLSYEPEALREFRERGYVTKEVDALQARLDAATELIRRAMEERHMTHARTMKATTVCGSPIGTSIDTCPNCQPFRAWLGDKEAGNGTA